jgi:hypothetical protein
MPRLNSFSRLLEASRPPANRVAMAAVRPVKIEISRETLARICLGELHMWPGCETVASVGILAAPNGGFMVRVIEYGEAKKRLADRAARCIEREKLRRYCLEPG